MIVYHGTTYQRLLKIYLNGTLKVTSDDISHYPVNGSAMTTRSYVYLTNNPLSALEFASRCWTNDEQSAEERFLFVIKISIPDSKLEDDVDECLHKSSSIKETICYRLPRSISTTEFLDIAFFQFSSFQTCCEYFDQENYDSIIWSSFTRKKWNGNINLMKDD